MAPEDSDIRRHILDTILSTPGIHMRDLGRRIGISLSGIGHHVRVLEKEGKVVAISDSHYKRLFSASLVLPAEARRLSEADRRFLAECRRPSSLQIALILAVDGPLRHSELEMRLGRTKGTVAYHLSRLSAAGIVRAATRGAEQGYELADADRCVSLLVTFSDTLRDHVESFASLWRSLRTSHGRSRADRGTTLRHP